MNKELFQQGFDLLLPEMEDASRRRATIQSALYGSSVLQAIDWSGAADTFTTNLIHRLDEFGDIAQGKPAIVALLEQIKPQIGTDRQAKIDQWLSDFFQAQAQARQNKEAPPALAYLCNRSPQETALTPILRDHITNGSRRPIVCLIHGDISEDYSGFLERLKMRVFPNHLNLKARGHSITDFGMAAPSRVSKPEDFWESLSSALLGYGGGIPDEIQAAAEKHHVLMLNLHLDTEVCKDDGINLFKHLLSFWQKWPDLPDGRLMIVCVCLAYKRYENSSLLSFASHHRRWLNKSLQGWLKSYRSADYPQITSVALPPLHAVTRGEVLTWTGDPEVRNARVISSHRVNKLFQQQELCNDEGSIPTDVLYPKLVELLKADD